MISNVRAFLTDDTGNATGEYALIACCFAVVMISTTAVVTGAATGQMSYTFTGLNNRNGVTP